MTVRLTTALRAFCLVTILAVLFLAVPTNIHGRWEAVGFLGVIFIFTSPWIVERQPMNLLLSTALIFYYGIRVWDVYVFDVNVIQSYFPLPASVQSEAGARAMQVAMFGSLAMYAGTTLPALAYPARQFDVLRLELNRALFFKIFVICSAFELLIARATFLNAGAGGFIERFAINYLLNHEAWFAVAAILFAAQKQWRYQWIVMLGCVMMVHISQGSRSGPLSVVEMFMAWAIIPGNWSGTFRISLRNFLFIILAIFVSIFLFIYTTFMREAQIFAAPIATLAAQALAADQVEAFLFFYRQISARIGTNLDTLLFVFSQNYDWAYANAHVNLATMWATIYQVTFHTPADPRFSFSELELSYLVGNRGSYIDGKLVPVGYSYGVFGYFYQIFGQWVLPALFVYFGLMGWAFAALRQKAATLTRDFMMWAVAHAMEISIPMFGLANLSARYQQLMIAFVFLLYVTRWLARTAPPAHSEKYAQLS